MTPSYNVLSEEQLDNMLAELGWSTAPIGLTIDSNQQLKHENNLPNLSADIDTPWEHIALTNSTWTWFDVNSPPKAADSNTPNPSPTVIGSGSSLHSHSSPPNFSTVALDVVAVNNLSVPKTYASSLHIIDSKIIITGLASSGASSTPAPESCHSPSYFLPQSDIQSSVPAQISLMCTFCRQPFLTKTQLTVHINKHTKPFICPVEDCPDRFAAKKGLQRHLLARSKWDNEHRRGAWTIGLDVGMMHRCDNRLCTYETIRPDNLKRH